LWLGESWLCRCCDARAITILMIMMRRSSATLLLLLMTACATHGLNHLGSQRDIVVVAHGRADAASDVRLLAQCATASLHLRHSMRSTRVWLSLPARGLTLACDGSMAAPLPAFGTTIKQVLEAHDTGSQLDELAAGWSVHSEESLGDRLAALGVRRPAPPSSVPRGTEAQDNALLTGRLQALKERYRPQALQARTMGPVDPPAEVPAQAPEALTWPPVDGPRGAQLMGDSAACGVRLVVLDGGGGGAALTAQDLSRMADEGGTRRVGGSQVPPTVVVLSTDESGFTDEEQACLDALGAERASAGPLQLMPSHAIVLAHAALDAEAFAACERVGGE
jgi:tRNA pseudouridine-54 N-methylase